MALPGGREGKPLESPPLGSHRPVADCRRPWPRSDGSCRTEEDGQTERPLHSTPLCVGWEFPRCEGASNPGRYFERMQATATKPEPKPLLRAREAADLLGVSVFTVRRYAAEGSLPAVRLRERGNLLFLREDITSPGPGRTLGQKPP
jgi:excisionase family DNA binding protein